MSAPNDKCSRKAQICNKVDTLEGSFEIASATALFYLKKAHANIQKGVSLLFKRCGQKISAP